MLYEVITIIGETMKIIPGQYQLKGSAGNVALLPADQPARRRIDHRDLKFLIKFDNRIHCTIKYPTQFRLAVKQNRFRFQSEYFRSGPCAEA